ncbi:MAG: OmpA family protein [Planctomycetes bacterium]|nr:OmpA family protein [Planctomycetota bacterium]MBI3844606.1 OmpA family protein [Planctomycetota bacterium]
MRNSIVVLVASGLLATGCVSREKYVGATNLVEQQDKVIKEQRESQAAKDRELAAARDQLRINQAELNRAVSSEKSLRSANEQLMAKVNDWDAKFGKLPTGTEIVATDSGYEFRIEGEVLFDSGKAEVKSEGKKTLAEIAKRLQAVNDRIEVDGHTDNVPVKVTANEFPMGNLQLSGMRALHVADFLIKDGGIPAERLSYAGYGEFQPRESNATDEGRRKNRRVEIKVITTAEH